MTTAPSAEVATRLVRELVERRLVACGTVLPGASSHYWWKGTVEESAEAVVLLKTTGARWNELKAAFPGLHPYEVPELLVVPIADGHLPYLEWLSAETDAAASGKE
jgi:periplasmic divalent cation tolerance protein